MRRHRCVWYSQPHVRKGCADVELLDRIDDKKGKERVCRSCKPALL